MCYLILMLSILIPPMGIVCGLLGLYHDFKHWKKYIVCIALGLAAIAYCYYPKGDPDIIRYVYYINSLRSVSLKDAISIGFKGETNTILFSFVCWISAKINDPRIIPALSVFFVYYIGFYVTCQIGEDYNIRKRTIFSYLLFIIFTLNFYAIINNVRNVFAFTVISFAIFRELYQKKRNIWTVLLYILPIFIHQSGVLFILIRIVFGMASKMKIVMFFIVGTLNYIVSAVHVLLLKINIDNTVFKLFKTLVIKADMYLNDTSSSWGVFAQKSITLRIERIINVGFAILLALILLYISRRNIQKTDQFTENRIDVMKNFSFIICMMTISCASMLTPEYWRFFSVCVLFSAVPYFELSKSINHMSYWLSKAFFLITPISFLLWMKSIVNSDLVKLFIYPFISGPLFVLLKDFLLIN